MRKYLALLIVPFLLLTGNASASSNKTCDLSPIGSPSNYWENVQNNLNSLGANDKVVLLKAGNGNYYFVGAPSGVTLNATQLDPWSSTLVISGGNAQVLSGNGLAGNPLFSATGNSFSIDKICGYSSNVTVDPSWTVTTHLPYSSSPNTISSARFFDSNGQIPPEVVLTFLGSALDWFDTYISVILSNILLVVGILAFSLGVKVVIDLFNKRIRV